MRQSIWPSFISAKMWCQGMPMASPSLRPITPSPIPATRPTASWPGDERQIRLHRPVAARPMQIDVAHAARFDLHENFAGTRVGDDNLLTQRLVEPVNDGRLHCSCHRRSLPVSELTRHHMPAGLARGPACAML